MLADDSESDLDEGEGAQGAWLANWVQDEFGADLQVGPDLLHLIAAWYGLRIS